MFDRTTLQLVRPVCQLAILPEGNTACLTGSRLMGGYVCSSAVHRRSRGPVGGKSPCGHRAGNGGQSTATGSGGRSLLLIRVADPPPPRTSHHFPAGDALWPPVAKSSYTDHPPSPPTIPATCGMLRPTAGTCSLRDPVCHRKNTPL